MHTYIVRCSSNVDYITTDWVHIVIVTGSSNADYIEGVSAEMHRVLKAIE